MLPNTPLHHLLMAELKGPIVLTSGNLSENPQETQNECARHNLAGIVDGFLMHNRDVVNRLDDSVVRQDRSGVSILRRARGYAPSPICLPTSFEGAPKVLALGGELKATFCLLDGRNAVLSQHIGDLENAPTLADYKKMLRLYLDLYQFEPDIVAVDAHPQYLSTRTGEDFARERGLPLVRVQHHHAHLAACLADQGQDQAMPATVHAVVLDGLGWVRTGGWALNPAGRLRRLRAAWPFPASVVAGRRGRKPGAVAQSGSAIVYCLWSELPSQPGGNRSGNQVCRPSGKAA